MRHAERPITATRSKKLLHWRIKAQEESYHKLALENQITRAEMLNRAELSTRLATIADAIVSRIMASNLTRAEKEDLLKDIASIPYAVQEVAHAQTRHASAKTTTVENDGE